MITTAFDDLYLLKKYLIFHRHDSLSTPNLNRLILINFDVSIA